MPTKCTLCSGNVVNGRCADCGMYFRDENQLYHLNESREAHLGHASREAKEELIRMTGARQTQNRPQPGSQQAVPSWQPRIPAGRNTAKQVGRKGNQSIGLSIVIFVAVIIGIVFAVIGNIADDYDDFKGGSTDYEDSYENDPVCIIEDDRFMPDGGGSASMKLQNGYYIAGCHIPEGTYTITAVKDDMDDYSSTINLMIHDPETGYENLILDPDADYLPYELQEVKLFAGTVLEIQGADGSCSLLLESDDANLQDMEEPVENPNTDKVVFKDTAVEGIDFPSGLYNIQALRGSAVVEVMMDGVCIRSMYLCGSEYGSSGVGYRNIYLSEGTEIVPENSEEDSEFVLIPAEDYYNLPKESWEW